MMAIEHFADRVESRCAEVGAPLCVGIDPVYERLPREVLGGGPVSGSVKAREAVEAIERFVEGVLTSVAGHAACVKLQSACFERYLWLGVEAYHRLSHRARKLGLIVIGDAKRGDIDVSAAHYAAGCLGDSAFADLGSLPGPDALTINAYFGVDGIRPFMDVAAAQGKGLFALVRTSNPGGDAVQSLRLADGRTVAEAVARMIHELGSGPGYLGKGGYSLLGAVVGATKARDVAALRRLMPNQLFLVPGVGAQGATPEEVKACFNDDGGGALISASRSVIYAYEKARVADWRGAVEEAAARLNRQIAAALG